MSSKKKSTSTAPKVKSFTTETIESLEPIKLPETQSATESVSFEEPSAPAVTPKPTSAAKGTVRIELSKTVEYQGKFYRGVQELDQKLAEKLLELEKEK